MKNWLCQIYLIFFFTITVDRSKYIMDFYKAFDLLQMTLIRKLGLCNINKVRLKWIKNWFTGLKEYLSEGSYY